MKFFYNPEYRPPVNIGAEGSWLPDAVPMPGSPEAFRILRMEIPGPECKLVSRSLWAVAQRDMARRDNVMLRADALQSPFLMNPDAQSQKDIDRIYDRLEARISASVVVSAVLDDCSSEGQGKVYDQAELAGLTDLYATILRGLVLVGGEDTARPAERDKRIDQYFQMIQYFPYQAENNSVS